MAKKDKVIKEEVVEEAKEEVKEEKVEEEEAPKYKMIGGRLRKI